MALDDPNIVDRAKCRFDVCVVLSQPVIAKGEVAKKILPKGPFAVFIHIGFYGKLEDTFTKIFTNWYPNSKEELANYVPFCEFIDMADKLIPSEQRVTKIYIPLI